AGAADHRFQPLDPRLRTLGAEATETIEHHPGRKQHLDGQPDLRLPTGRGLARCALDLASIVEQCSRASIEHLPDAREDRLASLDLEGTHLEHPLELLNRIGD